MLRKLCWLVGLTIFSPNTFWPSTIYIELYMCIYIYIYTNIFTHIYIYISPNIYVYEIWISYTQKWTHEIWHDVSPNIMTWHKSWPKSSKISGDFVATLRSRVFCVSSGLSPKLDDLEELRKLQRPLEACPGQVFPKVRPTGRLVYNYPLVM
jgi:hypothetical protein